MFRKLVFCALLALGCKQSASPPVHYGAYLPGGCVTTPYTVAYSDTAFHAASATTAETLLTLAANQRLCGFTYRVQTAFAGSTITTGTVTTTGTATATATTTSAYVTGYPSCSLGTIMQTDAGVDHTASYAELFSVAQTASTYSIGGLIAGTDLTPPDTNLNVILTCKTNGGLFGTGSVTNLTAGKVWLTIGVETLPAGS